MSRYWVEAGKEDLWEYKVTSQWVELINTLSPECVENLDRYNWLVTTILKIVPQRYQDMRGNITDAEWHKSGRYQLEEVWILKAHPDQIQNIKANLRITRNH
jgi:hypothetical protein